MSLINGYNYVGGNPVNRVDPSGMCWVNSSASPNQQAQCYDAWLAYTNIVTNTYTQNWPRNIQISMTQEARYWGNMSYSEFASQWNSSSSPVSNNTLSSTSQTFITGGGVLVIADGPLPIADVPGSIIIFAGLCLAGLAVLGVGNIVLPRHQVYDFGIVHSVAVPVDYDALDRDHSIPKKFPNQQCSEKLRLQLQDVKCTPMSRQQNGEMISGKSSFIEIDRCGCLVVESLMQSPMVIKVQIGGQAAASLTG